MHFQYRCIPPLQKFLDKVDIWSEANFLPISLPKCNIIHCLPQINPKISYFMKGFKLPSNQNTVRDLGLFVSSDLT